MHYPKIAQKALLLNIFFLLSHISFSAENFEPQIEKNDSVFGPQLKPRANALSPQKIQQCSKTKTDWSKEVIYFLLIDRFLDGNQQNNAAGSPLSYKKFDGNLKNKEALKTYQGGDLQGVIEKLDYIKDLGVTTLWLSPVFENANKDYFGWWPYHGYHPVDLYSVEDHFGDLELFKKLVAEAHKKGLKVLLDMTFNHVGPEHPLVVEKKNWKKLGFSKWFHPHSENDDSTSIKNWQDQKEIEDKEVMGLPDFNQENPLVYNYLLDVSKFWIEQTNVDGFRLDAVKHVHKDFWKKINHDIKAFAGSDFLMLGEVFSGDRQYLDSYNGLGFDSLFDIPLYYTLRQVFAQGSSVSLLSDRISQDITNYRNDYFPALIIDNHDVIRFSYMTPDHTAERIKLALSFIESMNGIPVIYYGTEVALEGGADRDPDTSESTDYLNRRMMPWDKVDQDLKTPDGITQHIKKLNNLRSTTQALSSGQFIELYKDASTYVFAKVAKKDIAVVALNISSDKRNLTISLPYQILKDKKELPGSLIKNNLAKISGDKLTFAIDPFATEIFISPNVTGQLLPPDYKVSCAMSDYISSDFVLTHFSFAPSASAPKTVSVAGDFNAWKTDTLPLEFNSKDKKWEAKIPLKPGRYLYKFVLDGKEWITDSSASEFEPDPYGGKNSVLMVKDLKKAVENPEVKK